MPRRTLAVGMGSHRKSGSALRHAAKPRKLGVQAGDGLGGGFLGGRLWSDAGGADGRQFLVAVPIAGVGAAAARADATQGFWSLVEENRIRSHSWHHH